MNKVVYHWKCKMCGKGRVTSAKCSPPHKVCSHCGCNFPKMEHRWQYTHATQVAKPLNTTQLASLRKVYDDGRLGCDGSTGKALVDRGYAKRDELGDFWITPPGRERAKKKADKIAVRDGHVLDPSLLEDLPTDKPLSVVIIDDSEHARGFDDVIKDVFPAATIAKYETALDASKHGGHVDLVLIDLSAIGSIISPDGMYSPICSLLGKYPGATVVINSAVSARFSECVKEDVRQHNPDSDIRIVDWSDCEPRKSLRQILEDLA